MVEERALRHPGLGDDQVHAQTVETGAFSQLQPGADEKGEWLKITYYDEDGADVSERFRVQTPAQRMAFEQLFIRPHTRTPGVPLRWITVADIVRQQVLLRHPDFVVARKKGQFWQVREKLFDYEGRFRRANELRG